MIESIPDGIELSRVEVWFQDESRVGQQGTVSRIWARKGTRPRVVRQRQFISAYIFGAVCPKEDKAVGLVLPRADAFAMQLHIQEISEAIPEGRHGVLVGDQAGWHLAKTLQWPKNLTFIPLPAASPELNPTEQLWEQLRDDDLSNRCFADYEDILESACQAWNNFTQQPGAVNRLCSRKWANLDI
ncbi:IS630 family transposase [Magnetococcales bacterium HHB-1]